MLRLLRVSHFAKRYSIKPVWYSVIAENCDHKLQFQQRGIL